MVVGWLVFIFGLWCVCGGNPPSNCSRDEFPCNDGSCVFKSLWCDTTEDCFDGSDEFYCFPGTNLRPNPNRCDESLFLCKDGICIPKSGRCDGYSSCPDNSDEEGCGTTRHETNRTTASLPEPTTEAKVVTSQLPATSNLATEHPQTELVHHNHNVSWKESPVSQSTIESTTYSLHDASVNVPQNTTQDLDYALDEHELSTEYSVPLTTTESKKTEEHDDRGVSKPDSGAPLDTGNTSPNPRFHDDAGANRNDSVQRDSESGHEEPSNVVHGQEENLTHKFTEIGFHDYRLERINSQKWLMRVRDERYGWGDETARAITALYMSGDDLKMKQSEKLLMSNHLNLKLFAALMRNETRRISLGELSLYINALSASCDNPRNFYGFDLVKILRQRTNVAHGSSLVPPFVYLTLCLNNATVYADLEKLHKFLHNTENIDKIGIEAMVFLASTCMYRNLQLPSSQKGFATRFLGNLRVQGLPANIYDLALVAQALNEARINQDLWNRSKVMDRIVASQKEDGSFGDVLSTYYVMPLLSGKSLASFSQRCDQRGDENLVPVEVLKNGKAEKWAMNYILRYGDPPELTQTLQLHVKKSTSFFDAMRIAETVCPSYRFKYVMSRGKPSVYSIGGVVNDAERGLYWSLYVGSYQRNGTDQEVLFEGDIRSFVPKWGQYTVFWLRPVF